MPLTFCAGGEEPWDAQENVLLPNCPREDPGPWRQACTTALLRQDFLLFMPQKNGSLCKSAMQPVFFSNYKIPVLSLHAIGFSLSCWLTPAVPSLQPLSMPALLLVAATCCLSPSSAVLCFLSCFIPLLTRCVPCGFSACKKGWLKGMDPGGCHRVTWGPLTAGSKCRSSVRLFIGSRMAACDFMGVLFSFCARTNSLGIC